MVLERRVEMCRSHTNIRTARLSERARDWKQSKNKMKKKKKKQWFTTWRSFFSVRFLWNSFVEKNQRLFMCRLFLVRIYVCFAFSYTLRSICYLPNLICRNKQHTHKKHIELRILNTCNETINSIQCSQRIFLYFFFERIVKNIEISSHVRPGEETKPLSLRLSINYWIYLNNDKFLQIIFSIFEEKKYIWKPLESRQGVFSRDVNDKDEFFDLKWNKKCNETEFKSLAIILNLNLD